MISSIAMHTQLLHLLPLSHALASGLGRWPILLGSLTPSTLHSVLHVRFGDDTRECPTGNAQTCEPETAMQQLQQGRSWAALVCCRPIDQQLVYTWLMQLRQLDCSRDVTVLALLDDIDGNDAFNVLRAGADAVLPATASPALIRLQLDRLRQRLAQPPAGDVVLDDGAVLHAASRELQVGEHSLALSPQALRLLWALGSEPGRVLSIARLRLALDIPAAADDQALHTAVARLRRLLRPHQLGAQLQTLHGVGYRWQPHVAAAQQMVC